jgi:hypothetical protein
MKRVPTGPFFICLCVPPKEADVVRQNAKRFGRQRRPEGARIAMRRFESILSGAPVNEKGPYGALFYLLVCFAQGGGRCSTNCASNLIRAALPRARRVETAFGLFQVILSPLGSINRDTTDLVEISYATSSCTVLINLPRPSTSISTVSPCFIQTGGLRA